jgi:hypothetical protein
MTATATEWMPDRVRADRKSHNELIEGVKNLLQTNDTLLTESRERESAMNQLRRSEAYLAEAQRLTKTGWDYPGQPILQPLGSFEIAVVPVRQLDACVKTPDVTRDFCNSNSNPNSPNPHCIPFAGPPNTDQSLFLNLSSQDCSNLLSLDNFFVQKTQNTTPPDFRLLPSGNVSPTDPLTVTNQQTTVSQGTAVNGSQFKSKVTSTAANVLDIKAGLDFFKILGVNLDFTQTSTTTNVFTHVSAQSLQTQLTFQNQAAVTTTIKDDFGGLVPVNVLQDSIFMGIAVQDTNMNLSCPKTQAQPRAMANVPLPMVPVGKSHAVLRKNGTEPEVYVQQTGYGYVIVRRPTNTSEIKAQIQTLHADAMRRHVTRAGPPPSPVLVSIPSTQDMLQILKRISSPPPPVQSAIKRLEPTTNP